MDSKTPSESNQPDTSRVDLVADLIAEQPDGLRQTLLAALVQARPVALDASQVGRVGTAALQVLWAFLRDARARQVPVQLSGCSQPFADALRATGLWDQADWAAARELGGA